ncbi:MAG: response regulator transcription factor [Actinomycetota bacterium]|nr:response regulator transcription factor [Actinomycetota bacterium]
MRIVVVSGPDDVTRAVLHALGGREPRAVVSVADALALCASEQADAVLVVWPADEADCRATLRSLVAVDAAVPLIVVVAPGRLAERRLLAAADVRYVPLPFDADEVMSLFGAPSGPPSTGQLRAGDIAIDQDEWTVRRSGHDVGLTRREFELLVHLMRHQRMVQSKDQLLAAVWGSHDYSHNVVEVTVGHLRRKLERLGVRVVHTVQGVGYVLRPGESPDVSEAGESDRRMHLLAERDWLIAESDRLIAERRTNSAELRIHDREHWS